MEIKRGLATFWRNRDWNEKQEVELQNDREGREEMPDLILSKMFRNWYPVDEKWWQT